jgi:hypothetical protein
MVPPYEEVRRDGAKYNIRDKVGGEVTPQLNPTYTYTHSYNTLPHLDQDMIIEKAGRV